MGSGKIRLQRHHFFQIGDDLRRGFFGIAGLAIQNVSTEEYTVASFGSAANAKSNSFEA
jgi:hypothetical protein